MMPLTLFLVALVLPIAPAAAAAAGGDVGGGDAGGGDIGGGEERSAGGPDHYSEIEWERERERERGCRWRVERAKKEVEGWFSLYYVE